MDRHPEYPLAASHAESWPHRIPRSLFLLILLSTVTRAEIPRGTIPIRLEMVANTLADDVLTRSGTVDQLAPVDMTPLGDGRQLVFTIGGVVRLLNANGSLAPNAYLNTANPNSFPAGGEVGPTTIIAHPDFLQSGAAGFGKFYTVTIENSGTVAADFGQGASHQNVLKEWTVADPLNLSLNQFVGASREVLRISQPGPFHGMFDMAFDSNGYLYAAMGDGGGNAYGRNSRQNAQDPTNVFGTVLRIDPLHTSGAGIIAGANGKYGIPTSNFGVADGAGGAMAEAFAYGFRSPYRVTTDRATDDLWIGDVGAATREEIDRVTNGGNFGWGLREGTVGTQPPGGIDPLFELYHLAPTGESESVTIVGGYVYRGSAIPELQGSYVFADFGERDPLNLSELYYGAPSTTGASTRDDTFGFIIDPDGEPLPERVYSIAEDELGELYLLGGPDRFALNNGTPGVILRIVPGIIAPNGIVGDVNQDGFVAGDGTGPALSDDVTAFVAGWLTTGHQGAFAQYSHGDMNFDGITDLLDAYVLHKALLEAQGSGFPFAALTSVPEPSTACFAILGLLAAVARRPRRSVV